MTLETKDQMALLHNEYKEYCKTHENCESCRLYKADEYGCFTTFVYLCGINKIKVTHKIMFDDKGV